MPSCAAPNCTNSSKKGSRLFRFPKDKNRRKIWIENCRREQWSPTPCSVLCEGHFEETQFELHRLDGWKKLRPNAIPTIFGVENPPKKAFKHAPKRKTLMTVGNSNATDQFTRERLESEHSYNSKPQHETTSISHENPVKSTGGTETDEVDLMFSHKRCELKIKRLKSRTRELLRQNQKLTVELGYVTRNLQQFLSSNQITHLKYNTEMNGRKGCIIPWDEETLSLSERLFLALGRTGYQYLRNTGYPMPSRRTLIRHRMDRLKDGRNRDVVEEDCEKSSDDCVNELPVRPDHAEEPDSQVPTLNEADHFAFTEHLLRPIDQLPNQDPEINL